MLAAAAAAGARLFGRAAALGRGGASSVAASLAADARACPTASGGGWKSVLGDYGRPLDGLQVAFAATGGEGQRLTEGKQAPGAAAAPGASPPGAGAGAALAAGAGGGGYAALAAVHAGLTLACWALPTETAQFFFPGVLPQGFQAQSMVQLLGCGTALGSAASFALKQSVDAGALASPTAQRLQLGLMGLAGGSAGLLAMYSPAITAASLGAGAAVAGATALVPYRHYVQTNGGLKPGEAVRSYFGAIPDHLNIKNLPSGLYAALTPALAAAGAAYLLSPGASLAGVLGFVKGADAFFFWQLVGGGLATLAPTATYSLKKLADEGRLGEGVGRTLNVGLLVASLGHLAVFGPMLLAGQGGSMLGGVVGAWAAGGLTAALGLARPGAAAAAKA